MPFRQSLHPVAAAALLAFALSGCDGGGPDADRPGEDEAAGTARHEGRWERIRGERLRGAGFQNMVPVVVGDRVVVVAGVDYNQQSVKTVLIDPGSRRAKGAGASGLQWRFAQSVVAADDRVILWGGCCGGGGVGSDAPGAIYDPAADRWSPLGPSQAGNRYDHTAVWTGDEMIVWGGYEGGSYPEKPLADGAAYDPRSDTWRTIARAPLSPRAHHGAVWTGEEMIVWGGSRPVRPLRQEKARVLGDGAAYDPERDRWRRIGTSPWLNEDGGFVRKGVTLDADWTGTAMIVWNGARGALYEPDRDRWKQIPPPPIEVPGEGRPGSIGVWTGSELIVWGGGDESVLADGAAYDPVTKRWAQLPEAPIGGRSAHAAIWTGEGMLIFGGWGHGRYESDAAIYLPG